MFSRSKHIEPRGKSVSTSRSLISTISLNSKTIQAYERSRRSPASPLYPIFEGCVDYVVILDKIKVGSSES